MRVTQSRITEFQKTVLKWYDQNKRDLPRRATHDPYHIIVSEIMAQQTQVSRVTPKYLKRLEIFPTVNELAKAEKLKVLTAWSGLWYNNRALRLQQTAQVIVKDHNGIIPCNYKTLINLPGIGEYTANAIIAFAFNKEVSVIDINIKRVLISYFKLDPKITKKELQTIAKLCIPKWKSSLRHNALMDYGSLVLTSEKTWIKSQTQSKFFWSKRWVRWGIIKNLIEQKECELEQLKQKYRHESFDQIVEQMQTEGIIEQIQNKIIISKWAKKNSITLQL